MTVGSALWLTIVVAWRYLSGHTLDGIPSTNATWFKRGTMPKHKVNWWSGKPRIHRALYRTASIAIPAGWIWLYTHYRFWTLAVTIGIGAVIIKHIWEVISRNTTRQVQIGTYEAPTEIHNIEVPKEANEQNKDLGEWPPKPNKREAM